MHFGYFTLSDNHYLNNTRSPNQFVQDILAEAVLENWECILRGSRQFRILQTLAGSSMAARMCIRPR
jgi:hypothetical protein